MKKALLVVLAFTLLSILFTGCPKDPQKEEHYTVVLDQMVADMGVYDRVTLTASVKDSAGVEAEDIAVTWESSDPDVAQVTDGVVTAKAEGEAEVTAKLDDGTCAVCRVTVRSSGMVPYLVAANAPEGTLSVARGQPFRLDGTVTFGGQDCTDADTSFSFTVEDTAVATVSEDGVITGQKAGSTKVTVSATWRGMRGDDPSGDENAYGLKLVIDLEVIEP